METKSTNIFRWCVIALLALVVALPSSAWAADTTPTTQVVTGVVKLGDTGEPAVGATITIKGSTAGATTDTKGQYSIKVNPKNNPTLLFSYLGYQSEEKAVGSRSKLDITLNSSQTQIDELVVIGYGSSVKRRDLTGSITSVSEKDIVNSAATNLSQALQGRMAGVFVSTADGAVDAETNIIVRGGTSLTQSNEPLYVVDGIIVDNIDYIPSSDIQSIDILKDASSTAIYGAQGANGVVVVTTKANSEGRARVTFNAYMQVNQLAKQLDVMDAYEYVMWEYEKDLMSNRVDGAVSRYGQPNEYHLYKKYGDGDDWQDEFYGRNAISQYYNLSVSGGGKGLSYGVTATHTAREGIQKDTGFERTNISGKFDFKIANRLSAVAHINYTHSDTDNVNVKISQVLRHKPIIGIGGSDSSYTAMEDEESLEQAQQRISKRIQRTLNTKVGLVWKLPRNVKLGTTVGYRHYMDDRRSFFGPYTSNAIQNYGGTPAITLDETAGERYSWTNTASWMMVRGNSYLTTMIGQEISSQNSFEIVSTASQFPMNITPGKAWSNFSLGVPNTISSNSSGDTRLSSFFTRINYTFKERYIFTFTARADGSNLFAKQNRWGVFPAGAFAWRISDEPFMQRAKAVSDLKLRVSYGAAGNNRVPSELYLKAYKVNLNQYAPEYNGDVMSFYDPKQNYLVNPDLRWETTITRNAGLDFSFFNHRLTGSVDAYWNTTKDLLVSSSVVHTTGFRTVMSNVGQTSNRGIEVALQGVVLNRKDLYLSLNMNFSKNKRRVDKLAKGEDYWELNSGWSSYRKELMDYKLEVGRAIGQMYGYVTDGMYQFEDFDYNYNTGKWTLKEGVADCRNILGRDELYPGMLKLKKLSGEGTIVNSAEDRTYIGDNTPVFHGGFGFNLRVKGFDLSAMFNYMLDFDVYNATKLLMTSLGHYESNTNMLQMVDTKHRFRYVNDEGVDLRKDPGALRVLNRNATVFSPIMNNFVIHSWAMEDGSFLRLNNVTLGYTLPSSVTYKIGVKSLRVYVTGENLFCWTNYSGFDPEVNMQNGLTPGLDLNTHPRSRSYTVGINIKF